MRCLRPYHKIDQSINANTNLQKFYIHSGNGYQSPPIQLTTTHVFSPINLVPAATITTIQPTQIYLTGNVRSSRPPAATQPSRDPGSRVLADEQPPYFYYTLRKSHQTRRLLLTEGDVRILSLVERLVQCGQDIMFSYNLKRPGLIFEQSDNAQLGLDSDTLEQKET